MKEIFRHHTLGRDTRAPSWVISERKVRNIEDGMAVRTFTDVADSLGINRTIPAPWN
ncbi:MAG TPA: hypothetical protein VF701_19030 [Thermoanaerobaculia bacterium]